MRGSAHVISLSDIFRCKGLTYLEFPLCAGGTLLSWCEKNGAGLVSGSDADAFIRSLAIWRQFWQSLEFFHAAKLVHGDIHLGNVLLTADQRPLLSDFRRSQPGSKAEHGKLRPPPTADYAAPELEEARDASVMKSTVDLYSSGVAMAKAFMGLDLQVSACPYHPTRGHRCLPAERTDVDLADLLEQLLAQSPGARPSAAATAPHRALDPAGFLRRKGLIGGSASLSTQRSPVQTLLEAGEQLREEYRGSRVDETLMFSRESVFDTISQSKVGEWREAALLGEWRVILNDESGVDGGGLRREVVSLFFEQFEQSCLVLRAGQDTPGSPFTLFVADRQRAGRSPQQWRQMWTSVGAMLLRAVVHFGNAPAAFSSAVFDCAMGRLCRLPPDDVPQGDEDDVQGNIDRLLQLREAKGDDWARSQMLDLLRRLRRADPQKEAGYRWMLAQRTLEDATSGGSLGTMAYTITSDSFETMGAMLEPQCFRFLESISSQSSESATLHGAAMEWVLLWDIYLKYLGGGDRWLAYDALAEGLTARSRRRDLWAPLTGEQICEALEGAALTPEIVIQNLEFKPSYGYDAQIQLFQRAIESFSPEELSMFLRFATGIGRLPASRRLPNGQKLTVRFMPDQLDRLPSAHTCFWVVEVPPYEVGEDMASKLRLAIAAPQPFALS